MQIIVDWEMCESHGNCMAAAPEVFEVRDDGALYLLTENPSEDLRAKIEEAVRLCPTQSLAIAED